MASANERIIFACKQNDVDALREIIESNPPTEYDINFTDGLGNTALHYSVQFSPDCLEFLLETEGCELDIQNRTEKSTPLHLAVQLENEDVKAGMVELLCDAGADPRIKDKHGAVPAEYLTKTEEDTDKRLIRLLAIATAELNLEGGAGDIASDDDYDDGDDGDEGSDYDDDE